MNLQESKKGKTQGEHKVEMEVSGTASNRLVIL